MLRNIYTIYIKYNGLALIELRGAASLEEARKYIYSLECNDLDGRKRYFENGWYFIVEDDGTGQRWRFDYHFFPGWEPEEPFTEEYAEVEYGTC